MKELLTYNLNELLSQVAKGDQQAFARVFFKESDKLSGYILQVTGSKEVTQEILQDVFLKIWQQRERLTDIESFDNYLFILARNLTINQLRKRATQKKLITGYTSHVDITGDAASVKPLNYGRVEALHREAISQLTPRQREVYLLSREEGLNRKAIAEKLGLSEETVKEHLKQALKNLRRLLQPHLGELWVLAIAFLIKF